MTSEPLRSHVARIRKLPISSFTLDFPLYSQFSPNCSTLQLWIRLCFVSGTKHIRWSVIGHQFRHDNICSSHLNGVQGQAWAGAGPMGEVGVGEGGRGRGVYTPDSHGTSRWLRGWPSMAIQSAAIIQGGPTSSLQQVISFIMRSLSKTNGSCVCQLWSCVLYCSSSRGRRNIRLSAMLPILRASQMKEASLEMMESTREPSNKGLSNSSLRFPYLGLRERDGCEMLTGNWYMIKS